MKKKIYCALCLGRRERICNVSIMVLRTRAGCTQMTLLSRGAFERSEHTAAFMPCGASTMAHCRPGTGLEVPGAQGTELVKAEPLSVGGP